MFAYSFNPEIPKVPRIEVNNLNETRIIELFFTEGQLICNNNNIYDFVKYYRSVNTGVKLPEIGKWDVSQVTSMNGLFRYDKTFDENINDWNVSNVKDMDLMFNHCAKFNQPLDNWANKLTKVVNMSYMFAYATAFNQNISTWQINDKCEILGMFYGSGMNNTSYKPENFLKKEKKVPNIKVNGGGKKQKNKKTKKQKRPKNVFSRKRN